VGGGLVVVGLRHLERWRVGVCALRCGLSGELVGGFGGEAPLGGEAPGVAGAGRGRDRGARGSSRSPLRRPWSGGAVLDRKIRGGRSGGGDLGK
jgi:hypothetical protein